MNTLDKIAKQLLFDLEGKTSVEFITQYDVKLEAIKQAILEYHDNGEVIGVVPGTEQKEKDFDIFWAAYGKKVGRTPAFKKWMKLKRVDIDKILATVEDFVRATPEVQYRPHPVTYINQRRWEDELPTTKPTRIPGTRVNTWSY